MEIIQQHKNGTILQCIKTYEELTEEEKSLLTLAVNEVHEDYKTFIIHKNKKDEIIRVSKHQLSDNAKKELGKSVDLVDALQVVYGKKGTKQHNKAKKRVNSKIVNIDNELYEQELESNQADLNIVQDVINSSLSAYKIEDVTGVARTTLSNIRNGKAEILNLSFANAIKLTSLGRAMKGGIL